ncbi:MAG: ComEC/Rec2 family competence protein [Sneathiella sp.]|uniref:ComEC/Rec2 family competence protein n=1 Tax=Sneathiella sp. TaxID=1964365 RepID=UPI003002018F
MVVTKIKANFGVSKFLTLVDRDRSRWFFWFPVALASGIALYFSLTWHPSPFWISATPAAILVVAFVRHSRFRSIRLFLFFVLAMSMGFSACIIRTYVVGAPVLQKKKVTTVSGVILDISSGLSAHRLLLGELEFGVGSDIPKLKYLRFTARMPVDHLHPGQIVETKVVLLPPPAPAYPGGFDFQRHSYFKSIGAVGYSISNIRVVGEISGTIETFRRLSSRLRGAISDNIKMLAPPVAAGFITAVSTGDKRAMPDEQIDNMRHSGLAHLLAISGLHMGMIGGLIFFITRFVLVLMPYVALHYQIKKNAAIIALLGLTGYLFISGMSVSAIRAYIMISAIFLAIFFDRTALSFRMVVLAALIILLLFPESLTTASFQMSFAAVFALISLYETIGPKLGQFARSGGLPRRLIAYVFGIVLTSLVAGLATAPFAVFHFGQVAAYSLIANLFAVPIMGLWVMPWGIVAFIAMPFQISFPFEMMGVGIDLILWIADETAHWPNSVQYLGTFSTSKLVLITLFSLWFMIWRTSIRWAALPFLCALLFAYKPSLAPDILISETGNLYAVRLSDEKLYLSSKRVEKFEAERWQLLFGPIINVTASKKVNCDPYGCVFLSGTEVIALPKNEQALAMDCGRVDIILSRTPVKRPCAALEIIDKFDLWRKGSHSIWLEKYGTLRIETVNGVRGDRPWVPNRYSFAKK